MKLYLLDKDKNVVEAEMREWGPAFEKAHQVIRKTNVGNSQVSTVFLGLDHNLGDEGPPIVFETMVFGGLLDGHDDRYATWKEAEEGHAKMIARVRQRSPSLIQKFFNMILRRN